MSKVEIVNRTQKRFVINSLNMIIGPHNPEKPMIRDSVLKVDPDISELVRSGMLDLVDIPDIPVQTDSNVRSTHSVQSSQKMEPSQDPVKKRGKYNKTAKPPKAPKSTKEAKESTKQKRGSRAVTFSDPNSSSDQMGGKVIIMGENGPQTSKMQPGMNAHEGPKFIGDQDDDNVEVDGDMDLNESEQVFRKIT